jgi:sortase A
MHAKAKLAGALIRRAWEQSLQSGKAEPPWPSADLRPIARLQIPRLGYDEIVLEGATPRSLAFGPAHMLSGARFGGRGNLLLAGHRTSWFLPLEQIMQNDAIKISWFDSRRRAQYERTYRVSLIRVVDATDFAMLAPTSEDALTLVTCYPFGRGAGSPQRYMVRALPAGPATNFAKREIASPVEIAAGRGESVWLRLRMLRRRDKEAAIAASLVENISHKVMRRT